MQLVSCKVSGNLSRSYRGFFLEVGGTNFGTPNLIHSLTPFGILSIFDYNSPTCGEIYYICFSLDFRFFILSV